MGDSFAEPVSGRLGRGGMRDNWLSHIIARSLYVLSYGAPYPVFAADTCASCPR